MSDPMKQAWNDVADGFSTLGRMMKERYQDAGEVETGQTATEGAASESDAAFRQAFERVVAAGREVGDRAVDVARDDDVKVQAKRAASSLNDALVGDDGLPRGGSRRVLQADQGQRFGDRDHRLRAASRRRPPVATPLLSPAR